MQKPIFIIQLTRKHNTSKDSNFCAGHLAPNEHNEQPATLSHVCTFCWARIPLSLSQPASTYFTPALFRHRGHCLSACWHCHCLRVDIGPECVGSPDIAWLELHACVFPCNATAVERCTVSFATLWFHTAAAGCGDPVLTLAIVLTMVEPRLTTEFLNLSLQ